MIDTGLLIAYASLGLMAITPIWLGSFESLFESKKADSKSDRLSSEDAYWFPVIGSGVLFGFYLLFKYFNKDYINYLLTAYFAMFGAASLGSQLSKLFLSLIPPETANIHAFDLKLIRHDKSGSLIDTVISWPVVLSYLLSALFTTFYVYTKHWVASNIFSLTFAISAVSLIHLDSFYTGICLLAGLFFYDVFWVFGTDVMVKVAKSFDVPVKLLFPKNILDWSTPYRDFALLGLGDIVIPGVFVALCLRFDEHLASKKKASYQKYYFYACFASYIIGLTTTIVVMHTFKAAQPALLYLSPACILSSLGVALLRGQLSEFFAFTTEEKVKVPSSPLVHEAPAEHIEKPTAEVRKRTTAGTTRKTA